MSRYTDTPVAAPEGWTPRQREVLDLLARGATNVQIGEALGISLDGAKWHVSEILSKLGVASREEAADYWREHQRPAARLRRALVAAPWAYAAGAAAGLGLIVAVVTLVLLANRDSGGSPASPTEPPEATPSGIVASTATPSAPAIDCPANIEPDICEFATVVEQLLQSGQIDSLLPGSPLDTEEGRAQFDSAVAAIEPASARLVSIGCPVAAIPLECGGTFGLGFSSVPQTDNPYIIDTGIITLAFWRDPDCDFSTLYTTGAAPDCSAPASGDYPITGAAVVTVPAHRQVLAGGGLIQFGTYAGRPTGITDSDVRSEWFPIAPPGQVDQVNGVSVEDWDAATQPPATLEGVAYIVSGCWGCDGPPSSLDRVYRNSAGELVREELRDGGFNSLFIPPGPGGEPLVTEIYLTTCTGACGPIGPLLPGAVSELHQSTDGGISWTSLATFPGYAIVLGPVGDELLLGRATNNDDYGTVAWPSGRVVTASGVDPRAYVTTPDGRIAYRDASGTRYLFEDGTVFWESPFGLLPSAEGVQIGLSDDGRLLIAWFNTAAGQRLWTVFVDGDLMRVYRGLSLHDWYGAGDLAHGMATLPVDFLDVDEPFESTWPFPAQLDYATGRVTPIEPRFFVDEYGLQNRRWLYGYQAGPLLKVTGAGDCLNVRTEPSTSAPIITCYRDGVLVTDGGEQREADSVTWRSIRIGVAPYSGWASTEFLE